MRATSLLGCLMAAVVLVLAPSASGAMRLAPGKSSPSGPTTPYRYTVEVERGLTTSPASVAREIEQRIADHRGWGANHRRSFQRVSRGRHHVRIILASATTTQRMCRPLNVRSYWNCYQGGKVILNYDRWQFATPVYAGDLASYRSLMVMHELGHALGHGHAGCPRAGSFAPAMMQQSKGLHGCRRNPWPHPNARRLPSRCAIHAERITGTQFLRIDARVEWVGTQAIIKLYERRDGRWVARRATLTSSLGSTRWLVRSGARFFRAIYSGTESRRACSAVTGIT